MAEVYFNLLAAVSSYGIGWTNPSHKEEKARDFWKGH